MKTCSLISDNFYNRDFVTGKPSYVFMKKFGESLKSFFLDTITALTYVTITYTENVSKVHWNSSALKWGLAEHSLQ